DAPESVYAPPAPPEEGSGGNEGGVHYDLTARFLNRYLFRGIMRFRNQQGRNNLNLQLDGTLSFDTGRYPHPFVEAFVNVDDDDSVSRFQEVRPTVGANWDLKPMLLSAGYIDYLFPEREKTNDTQEIYLRTAFDDSRLWNTSDPVLTPYLYTAYDFERYNGWYFESGISHDIPFEDYGLNLRFLADVALVVSNPLFRGSTTRDTGFQHYDVGMEATYSLNHALALSKRFGEFDLVGYLYYSSGIDPHLRADSQLWGGAGISFSY
ncbi:MAG: hypothetical protein JO353_12525, partial [Phycisphaerae bacterium]|nr:hypothetical protein [Phycisphaerae bacterium]